VERIRPLLPPDGDADALPEFLSVSEAHVNRYWNEWLLYRASGHELTFTEAHTLPGPMLNVFFELDGLFEKMSKQLEKERAKRKKKLHG
jgi:hypothetical protein